MNNETIVYANPTNGPLNGGSSNLLEIHLTGVSSVSQSDFLLPSSNPLVGGSGPDVIVGTTGNDIIDGGFYADTLTGNGGTDTYLYSFVADSRVGLFDTITDFVSGNDSIDLTAFGTGKFTTFKTGTLASATNSVAAGTIAWFDDSAHNQTIVYANPTGVSLNGDDPNFLEIHLTGVSSVQLADFLTANSSILDAPARIAGEPINLGLTALPADDGEPIIVTIAGLPSGWALDDGTQLPDGTWTVQTSDPRIGDTSPPDFAGAMLVKVTEARLQADGSTATTTFSDNVEVYPAGSPIFAWSGTISSPDRLATTCSCSRSRSATTPSTTLMPTRIKLTSSAMPDLSASRT